MIVIDKPWWLVYIKLHTAVVQHVWIHVHALRYFKCIDEFTLLVNSYIWCVFVYSIDNKVHIPKIDDTTTAAVQYTANDDGNDSNQQQTQTPAPAVCIRNQPRAHISSSLTDKVYTCICVCVCLYYVTCYYNFKFFSFKQEISQTNSLLGIVLGLMVIYCICGGAITFICLIPAFYYALAVSINNNT